MKIAVFIHQPACSVDSANGIIQALSPHFSFKLFSKDEVENTFFKDVDLVCFPGGIGDSDRFDRLMKDNTKHVKRYLERGGKYLGICMGAYWADQDYFDILKNTRAVQYIKRPNTDTRRPHAKAISVTWRGQPERMYFYDGCTFEGKDFKTYATYANGDPMAIIQDNLALIGCHPESQKYWYHKKYLQPHWHGGKHYKLLADFVDQFMQK